jgi:hypothetical protein
MFFTVFFYGLRNFDCKTMQFSETLRESGWLRSSLKNTLCKAAKTCAIR